MRRKYTDMYLGGDIDARNVLIEHNLRLVAHIIKKYYTQTNDQDDLISIGTIGLIKGVSTYNPDKGVRLATYASRCIENEILMYFRSLKKSAGDLSLSDSIDTDKDGNSLSLMDVISVDDDMLENISSKDTYLQLRRYVKDALTPREQLIISLRYGLDGAPLKPSGKPPRNAAYHEAMCPVLRKRPCQNCKSDLTTMTHTNISII